MMRWAQLFLSVGILAGCAASGATPAETTPPGDAEAERSSEGVSAQPRPWPPESAHAPFGEARWGFVEASTSNGRFIVLRRFEGASRPDFGHHGTSSVPSTLSLVDAAEGTSREIVDWLGVAHGRRWLLLLDDAGLFLVDGASGAQERLEADLEDDGNACLPPRAGAFSQDGGRVAWIAPGAQRLMIRDLRSGETWSIESPRRIWRAEPEDERRSAVLLEVSADRATGWPTERTSCACRWCDRFAASSSFSGWDGPAFEMVRVTPEGQREAGRFHGGESQVHGRTLHGCVLDATAHAGEPLEFGPWRWACPELDHDETVAGD